MNRIHLNYIKTLQAITTVFPISLIIWVVASYVNIMQHNMGSCEYAAWNLITKMLQIV